MSHDLVDLDASLTDHAGGRRELVIDLPGLKVLHLSLRPGQRMPLHDHPGCHVTIQGLAGAVTVRLDDSSITLRPRQLLSFAGESRVSPGNDSDDDCAALITLVERPVAAG